MLDKNRFASDDPIGEAFLSLADLSLAEQTSIEESELFLQPVEKERFLLGTILLTLAYDPNKERLSLTVIKCQDLKVRLLRGPECGSPT